MYSSGSIIVPRNNACANVRNKNESATSFGAIDFFFRAFLKKIHLNPSPVQIEMDDKKDYEQYAVRVMDPVEKDIQIYACISLTKTGHYLYKHDKKENWIYYLEYFLFHGN